jgi:protein-tyrosine phosphatase
MAEGIFRHHAAQLGIHVTIDSAGTSGHHSGEAPDRRAISCLSQKGIDISGLRARKFERSDIGNFDMILVMDHSNMSEVTALCRNENEKSRISYFLDVLPEGSPKHVPDPWYGDQSDFEYVYELLTKATISRLSQMQKDNEAR